MMVRFPGRVSPLEDLTAITNSSFPCWLVPVRMDNECDSITVQRVTIRNDDLTIGTIKGKNLCIHGNIIIIIIIILIHYRKGLSAVGFESAYRFIGLAIRHILHSVS